MLQCAAECCSVLSCDTKESIANAMNFPNDKITLQHTATHCNTLQRTTKHTATHWNTLPHTGTHTYMNGSYGKKESTTNAVHVSHDNTTLQHTATHSNTLHHTAKHCKTQQQSDRYAEFMCHKEDCVAAVAFCCSVLQCVAVCCRELQCVAAEFKCHKEEHCTRSKRSK